MSNFSNFALKLANSNLASAFFGAILGALTLWSIEWIKEEHALIKDVNTSLAGLKYLSETLLNMKKQIVIPICQAYQNNIEQIRKSAGQPVHLNLSTNTYSAPRLSFNFPTNRIFSKVTVVPKIIDSIIYLQNSMEQLDHLWQKHNSSYRRASTKRRG
ncbi:MAG: hypothetical protein K0Q50_392 [Vampirovibrio sp.]|nr:hypothetical protein [Vampirovibrio sp.]